MNDNDIYLQVAKREEAKKAAKNPFVKKDESEDIYDERRDIETARRDNFREQIAIQRQERRARYGR